MLLGNIKYKFKDTDKEIYEFSYNKNNYIYKGLTNYNEKNVRLLKNEVIALKRLDNLRVAPKYYYSEFNNENYFIIEEMIDGQKVNEIKFKSIKDIIKVILKISSKIRILHENKIIHCDLKPSNIILGKDGEIYIIDYGICVIDKVHVGYNFVSLSYCSLRQLEGKSIDENVDVYALGVIFYELVMKRRPFGNNKEKIIENKKKGYFYHTDNPLLDEIFTRLFSVSEYHMTLDEFDSLLRVFLD